MEKDERTRLRKGIVHEVGEGGRIVFLLHPVAELPVLKFEGEIGGGAARDVLDALRARLNSFSGVVIFDLEACSYMSSEVIGFVTSVAFERHESGGALYLSAVSPKILGLLALMDMDDFFHVRESVDEAVSHIMMRRMLEE